MYVNFNKIHYIIHNYIRTSTKQSFPIEILFKKFVKVSLNEGVFRYYVTCHKSLFLLFPKPWFVLHFSVSDDKCVFIYIEKRYHLKKSNKSLKTAILYLIPSSASEGIKSTYILMELPPFHKV